MGSGETRLDNCNCEFTQFEFNGASVYGWLCIKSVHLRLACMRIEPRMFDFGVRDIDRAIYPTLKWFAVVEYMYMYVYVRINY